MQPGVRRAVIACHCGLDPQSSVFAFVIPAQAGIQGVQGACDATLSGHERVDLVSRATVINQATFVLLGTIVLWSGEFGRLPVSQNGKGRDHNRNAFSLLLAGGGFRAGHVHGATDEVGYRAAEGRVSVADLHATLLHQLGLDHQRLTYLHHGRPETPTDAVVSKARVVRELLAGG